MKDDKLLYILLAVAAFFGINYWYKKQHGISLIDKLMGKEPEKPAEEAPADPTAEAAALAAAHTTDTAAPVSTGIEEGGEPTGTVYMTEIPSAVDEQSGRITTRDTGRINSGLSLARQIITSGDVNATRGVGQNLLSQQVTGVALRSATTLKQLKTA